MTRRRQLRAVRTIVQTDLRAAIRSVRDQPRLLVGWLLGGVFFVGAGVYAFIAGVGAGIVLQGGEFSLLVGRSPAATAGIGVVGLFGTSAFFGLSSLADEDTTAPVDVLLRTSLPTTTVVLARQVSSGVRGATIILVPAVGGVLGLGIGARSVSLFVLALAVAVLTIATGFALGRLAGATARVALASFVQSAWLRIPLQGLLAVVMVVGIWLTIDGTLVSDQATARLSDGITALGTGILWPIEGTPDPIGIVGLLVLGPAAVLTTSALVQVETRRLVTDHHEQHRQTAQSRAVPAVMDSRLSTGVAWRLLVRSARNPVLLSHLGLVVLYPLFVLPIFVLQGTGGLALIGGAIYGIGIVFAGGAYCLNPFGDDRQQTPLLLSSVADLRPVLHGRAIAGLLIGTPVVVVGIGVLTLSGSTTVPLGALLLAPVLLLSSVGTALGIGALLPKHDRSEYMNVERVHPSVIGTTIFEFGGFIVVATGLVGWIGVTTIGLGSTVWVVSAGYLVIVLTTGIGGYAYARKRATDRRVWTDES